MDVGASSGGKGVRESSSTLRNYAMGLVFGLIAIGLRQAAAPIMGPGQALPTFFPAVAAAAFLEGTGPALATLGLMLAASPWLPTPPGSEASAGGITALGLALYALSGGGVAYLGGRPRRAPARCEADRRAVDRLREAPREEAHRLREPRPALLQEGRIADDRRFREVADSVAQFVYIVGVDDGVAYLNRRWFEYTGASRDHAEVKDAWLDAIHPDDVATVLNARSRSKLAGEPTEIEYRIRGRDGSFRWFLGRSVWLRDESGALSCRIGTATDIDDQKRAERAARFLADAGAGLAALDDPESALRDVAELAVPAFADWCAVDLIDVRGELRRVRAMHDQAEPLWIVETISHRYRLRPDMPGGLFQVLADRRPSLIADLTEGDLRAAARNDEHLTALRAFNPRSYLCVPVVGRGGVLGALSFATSRSGRRLDSGDLTVAVDLAARAAVALENARLYERLDEIDRRKDDFLATLAHELRSPMAPISNAVSFLRFKGTADPDSRWAHGIIERQVARLVRLVDDLLDASRLTRDKLELRLDRMDLTAAVSDALEIIRPAVDSRGQELRLEMPPGPIPMVGDRTRLAQAIGNLLDNASKFSGHGATIDLRVGCDGDRVEVSVADQGEGIPADHLPRIFEMFSQFTPALDRLHEGLGIGLALARGLVELHGGTIEARSRSPRKGTVFLIRLPLEAVAADDPRRSPAQVVGADGRPARAQVLVVDDSEDIAESLGRLLSLYGCEVHLAYDGESGLRLADAVRPGFAVLDIGLPGMNGYELAQSIRAESWGRDVVLIAVTGWGGPHDRRLSAEAGFNHHLVKPVEPAALAQIIASSAPA